MVRQHRNGTAGGKGEKMSKERYIEYINRMLDGMNEKDVSSVYYFLLGMTGGNDGYERED